MASSKKASNSSKQMTTGVQVDDVSSLVDISVEANGELAVSDIRGLTYEQASRLAIPMSEVEARSKLEMANQLINGLDVAIAQTRAVRKGIELKTQQKKVEAAAIDYQRADNQVEKKTLELTTERLQTEDAKSELDYQTELNPVSAAIRENKLTLKKDQRDKLSARIRSKGLETNQPQIVEEVQ